MAEIGFERADRKGLRSAVHAENTTDGRRLDRIADRRTGSVSLDIVDIGGIDGGAFCQRFQHCLLGLAAGRRQRRGVAILIDHGVTDHPVDPVAIGDGTLQRLQKDEAAAFAANEAIGSFVECVDAAGRRKHVGAGEGDKWPGIEHAIDPAGQCHVARTHAEVPDGLIDGDECR